MDQYLQFALAVIMTYLAYRMGYWHGVFVQRHYALAEFFVMLQDASSVKENEVTVEDIMGDRPSE